MKITDSSLSLQSAHEAVTRDVSLESLQVWRQGSEPESLELKGGAAGVLRQRAMALLQSPPATPVIATDTQATEAVSKGDEPLDNLHELEMSLLKLLVERFSGHRIQVVTPDDLRPADRNVEASDLPASEKTTPARQGWGMVYRNYQSHYEAEHTRFQAQGVVKTSDGQEITLDIQLSMSREFLAQTETILRAGDALKDPLVVNFAGAAAELTQQSYSFDLDADGVSDQVHFVTSDSGFLALDRNQDGLINDGSELFGTRSGDGFADLARYDSDGNDWIDENDPVFETLRIWSKDVEGQDQLVALGARGIGAIYLGHITTPFELKNEQNTLLGVIRDSGLYLREEGGAGTLQQIDLVV
jgi:hypothetical protein